MLAGLAAAGVAIGAPGTNFVDGRERVVAGNSCNTPKNTIGRVTVIGIPKIWHNGKLRRNRQGFSLRRKDGLRAAKQGEANFCLTEGATSCRFYAPAKLRVKPNSTFVFKVTRGEVLCSTSSGGTKVYGAGDTEVDVGDPVFSVTVTKAATIVKVFRGAVAVRGDSGRANPVYPVAGSQTTAKRGEGAQKPVPISLSKRERGIFNKLAGTVPRQGLTEPKSEGSKALQTILDRGALLVEIEPNANKDASVRAFTQDFLAFLGRSWGLTLKVQPPRFATDVAPRLAGGAADLFVTWAPEEVTDVGFRKGLGDKAGVAAVPFVVSGRQLFHLAIPADAGLARALRRFLTTAALQTDEYGSRYVKAFDEQPPYERLGDLAFPTKAHTTGTATIVHHSFAAVVKGRLGPGLKIVETLPGTCQEPSRASARSDAWTCVDTKTQRTWDPCFSGIEKAVVCPSDPPTTKQPTQVAKLNLLKPLPPGRPKAEPTAGLPRLIRTTAGPTCQPQSGTPQAFGSQQLNYVCGPAPDAIDMRYLVGAPFRTAAPWVMLFVPRNYKEGTADTTGLAEVWFW